MREWHPLAEQGDTSAQTNLGLMYGKGEGVALYAIQASYTPYEIAAASGLENLDDASLATLWEASCGVEFVAHSQDRRGGHEPAG